MARRVLDRLRAAGLLTAGKGRGGGWRLARPSETITRADVHLALDARLAPEAEDVTPCCAVERALEHRMAEVMEEAETALVARLTTLTIAEAQVPV